MTNKINEHEYVDLGLPSGIKWATCNVGANTSKKYGEYYAWGEIEPKQKYSSNSLTSGKKISDIGGNSTYDVARAKWGGSWRMPTKNEFEELEAHCKFKVVYKNFIAKFFKMSSQIKGVRIISKSNGKSIFLPAAGKYVSYYKKKKPYEYEKNCYYWTSTPDLEEEGNLSAYLFYAAGYSGHNIISSIIAKLLFWNAEHRTISYTRDTCCQVRPVSD